MGLDDEKVGRYDDAGPGGQVDVWAATLTDLHDEEVARQAADGVLDDRVDAEAVARDAAIASIPAGAAVDVFALRKLGTGATEAAAGDHDHDGVYEPVGNEIWLPPNVGGPSSTSPPTSEPISLLGAWDGEERWPALWFDASTVQSWSYGPFRFPLSWESFDFVTHWVKTSASGDVVLRGDYSHRTPSTGTNIAVTANGVIGTPVTLTAPVGFLEQTVILLSDIPITAGEIYMVRVSRLASDAADTLTSKFPLLDGLLREHV